jgi:ketosteroid isomerase-like protein
MADDIDGVVGLLTEDAWFTMPPSPLEYQGRTAIYDLLAEIANRRAGRRY